MIKQPWLAVVSAILLVVVIGLVVERMFFLMTAETVMGEVVGIAGSNDTCGSRKRRHSCTEFQATVRYAPKGGGQYTVSLGAGSSRGHDRPVTEASFRAGQPVEVIYDPASPAKAYQNTLFGVWAAPIIAFFGQIATMIGSLSEGRRRRW